MPIYEFKCKKCEHIFEELRNTGDFSNTQCPKCKSIDAEKIFSLFSGSSGKSDSTCAPSAGG